MTINAPDIHIVPEGREWARRAEDLVLSIGRNAIRANGRFLLTLSGGSTPKLLYNRLAESADAKRFDWTKTVFLFGDERAVPPDHQDSNFGLADKALFSPLHIAPTNIHRMHAEERDMDLAAHAYGQTLRSVTNTAAPARPKLDLILLGLGEDGHTASLFPGTAALNDPTSLIVPTQSPKGIPSRLTMTLGVINRASVVLFLVTGADKASIVKRVLEPATEADRRLPSAMVKPEEGRLVWLLDHAAAAMLTER